MCRRISIDSCQLPALPYAPSALQRCVDWALEFPAGTFRWHSVLPENSRLLADRQPLLGLRVQPNWRPALRLSATPPTIAELFCLTFV